MDREVGKKKEKGSGVDEGVGKKRRKGREADEGMWRTRRKSDEKERNEKSGEGWIKGRGRSRRER